MKPDWTKPLRGSFVLVLFVMREQRALYNEGTFDIHRVGHDKPRFKQS